MNNPYPLPNELGVSCQIRKKANSFVRSILSDCVIISKTKKDKSITLRL